MNEGAYYVVYFGGWASSRPVEFTVYEIRRTFYEAKLLAELKSQQWNIQYLVIHNGKIVAIANPTTETVVKNVVKVTTF